ncbi:hypothetical protein UT300012_24390 [Paraclostridium bifermentans]
MKEVLECKVCNYKDDDSSVGKFITVKEIFSEDVERLVACPVCGALKAVFHFGYYEPNKTSEVNVAGTSKTGLSFLDLNDFTDDLQPF